MGDDTAIPSSIHNRRLRARATRVINLALDEELLGKVEILLFSPAEDRVPKGAYQRLFNRLMREMFESRELDLAPYAGTLPGTAVIRGGETAIAALRRLLEA